MYRALKEGKINTYIAVNCLEQLLACYVPSELIEKDQIKLVETLFGMVANQKCEYVIPRELVMKLSIGVALLIVSKTNEISGSENALKYL